jgi:uncharacterized protein
MRSGLGLAAVGFSAGGSLDARGQEAAKEEKMPTRALGRTGHKVGLFSLGGQALLEKPGVEEQALAIINRAIDLGVNYLDTAATYGGGVSEQYLGQVMKTRRKEVYLASKTSNRTYDGSMRLLERSLKNLQTDHLDAWQIHHIDTQADVDAIFAKTGALKALEKARDQKMVRFLGVTGHRDAGLLKTCIERYPFDQILMALNAADSHPKSFARDLLPVAVEKKLGVIGMKVTAKGRIFRPGGIERMDQAMGYVLSLPVSTAIVGISSLAQVEENARVARNFKPLSPRQMSALRGLSAPYQAFATFYRDPEYRST